MTLDLEAIKARAEAATPGPWRRLNEQQPFGGQGRNSDGSFTPVDHEGCQTWPWMEPEDMAFAYAARTDVPALVAEVELLRWLDAELTQAVRLAHQEADEIQAELQAEVERLRARLDEADDYRVDL